MLALHLVDCAWTNMALAYIGEMCLILENLFEAFTTNFTWVGGASSANIPTMMNHPDTTGGRYSGALVDLRSLALILSTREYPLSLRSLAWSCGFCGQTI